MSNAGTGLVTACSPGGRSSDAHAHRASSARRGGKEGARGQGGAEVGRWPRVTREQRPGSDSDPCLASASLPGAGDLPWCPREPAHCALKGGWESAPCPQQSAAGTPPSPSRATCPASGHVPAEVWAPESERRRDVLQGGPHTCPWPWGLRGLGVLGGSSCYPGAHT